MKCPACGHWNKPSFPRCFKCGEPLNPRDARDITWRDDLREAPAKPVREVYDDTVAPVEDLIDEAPRAPAPRAKDEAALAEEMNRLKDRRARGSVYLDDLRRNAAEQGIAPAGTGVTTGRGGAYGTGSAHVVDAPDADNMDAPAEEASARGKGRTPPPRTRAYQDFADPYDPDLPPLPEAQLPIAPLSKKKRRRRMVRGPILIAYALVGLLVLGLVVFAVFMFITPSVLPDLLRRNVPEVEDVAVFVSETTVDGQPGRQILIPGAEGTQVYIPELMKTYVVVGGVATINVADHVFYDTIEPLDVSMETLDVSLNPTLNHNGKETRIETIRYTVDIPLSPVRLIKPDAAKVTQAADADAPAGEESLYGQVYQTTTSASIINMELEVMTGSRVLVHGRDESDTINDAGIVTYSQSIQAIGTNSIPITVKAPYCRENSLVVQVYREPMEIPLDLDPSTAMNASKNEFTFHGTTLAGAQLICETPYVSIDDSQLGTTGAFTIVAKMTRVGDNTIALRATYEGKVDSTLEHTVYYVPPAADYTPKAWVLDTNEVMTNIERRIKDAQIYLCRGEIKEILSNNPQIVIMDAGTAIGREQLVLLENRSKGDPWVLGEKYDVYADVSGVYNTMPRLIGRYTYSYMH